jgi:hypothetical protein
MPSCSCTGTSVCLRFVYSMYACMLWTDARGWYPCYLAVAVLEVSTFRTCMQHAASVHVDATHGCQCSALAKRVVEPRM